MPYTSERIATEGALGLGFVALNSSIPEGECSGDGTGVSYCFNDLYGLLSCTINKSTSGLLSRPNVVLIDDSDSKYSYGNRTATGRRTLTIKSTVISTGSKISDAGNTPGQNAKVAPITIMVGRTSWREIRNFREN